MSRVVRARRRLQLVLTRNLKAAHHAVFLAIVVTSLGLAGCVEARAWMDRTVFSSRQAVALEEPGVVPLRVYEAFGGGVLAFVPVRINDQGPFDFALDTGASHSVIDDEIAASLELREVGRSAGIAGVAGTAEATIVEVETWSIGDVPLPSSIAVRLDLPNSPQQPSIPGLSRPPSLQGLLGSDILSRFGAVTIDYDQRKLILRPQERP